MIVCPFMFSDGCCLITMLCYVLSPNHTPEIHLHVSNPQIPNVFPLAPLHLFAQRQDIPPPVPSHAFIQLPTIPLQHPFTEATDTPAPNVPTQVPAPVLNVIDLTDLLTSDVEDNDNEDNIPYPLIRDLLMELNRHYSSVQYIQYSQRMVEAGFS
jgi:hypothetical protein